MYSLNGTPHPKHVYPDIAVLGKCSVPILLLPHQGTALLLHLSLISKNNSDTDESEKYIDMVSICCYQGGKIAQKRQERIKIQIKSLFFRLINTIDALSAITGGRQ